MSSIIPTSPDDPFYTQISEIEGVDYTLTFRYNQREDRWYLTIGDSAGVDIVKGIKLTLGEDLVKYYDRLGLFEGELFLVSTGAQESPGMGELGIDRRCQLVYNPRT